MRGPHSYEYFAVRVQLCGFFLISLSVESSSGLSEMYFVLYFEMDRMLNPTSHFLPFLVLLTIA